MTEATQTGAEEVQATPNPRNAALEQIANTVEEQKKEEFAPLVPEVSQETPAETPAEKPEKEPEKAPEPEAKTEEQEHQEEHENPQERLVTIKVDGREMQVPESQIIEAGRRTLQKEVAADRRLEEATRLLREAEARAKQPPKQDVAQAPQQYDAATLAQALTSGDQQLAALAVEEIQKAGRQPQQAIPPEAIFGFVRQEIEATTAQEQFKSEYADIVKDPFLLQLAVNLEDQRLAKVAAGQEPVIPLYEAFKQHGETIRKWRGTQTQGETLSEKRERKATAQTLPSAKAKAPAPESEKPETTEDIIQQMRRARRQIK